MRKIDHITLFHATKSQNVKSILENGLIVQNNRPLYFSENIDFVKKFGEVIFVVRVPVYMFFESFFDKEDAGGYLRSYSVYYNNIPKEMIKVLQ